MDIPDTIDNFLTPLALSPASDDHLLPGNLSRQLGSIINHYQNKRGNMLLFSGGSISASIAAVNLLAKLMSKDVYRIDLSAAASRHLGETEKHLLQVFEFADKHDFILLFDEADSLFGNSASPRDSHDRYANLDVQYLLKRIEAFSGMVIITTNEHANPGDTLLAAVPWQISLQAPASHQRLPWWQRLFKRA